MTWRSRPGAGAERPRVIMRADGGAGVGLGHVRRQLALAQAIGSWAECRLLLGGDAEAAAWARARGAPCALVDRSMGATLAAVSEAHARALVVDTYEFSVADLARARDAVSTLVLLDDLGEFPLPAHLVVNAAAGVRAPAGDAGSYLLGPRFALLDAAFAAAPTRPWRAEIERALLVLGAAPPPSAMRRLAVAVRGALPGARLDVVVGPGGDRPGLERALQGVGALEVHEAPPDMRALMLGADVAVTAGGVTLLELAATATPMIGVCLAPNQRANLLGLAEGQALLFAGDVEDPHLAASVGGALSALRPDAARRRALGERARQLVDGRGAARVGAALRAHVVAAAVAAR